MQAYTNFDDNIALKIIKERQKNIKTDKHFVDFYDIFFHRERKSSKGGYILNPFPNKPWFFCVCSTSLLKTLWEKREIAHNKQFLLFPKSSL